MAVTGRIRRGVLVVGVVAALTACSSDGSEFDREWAAQQSSAPAASQAPAASPSAEASSSPSLTPSSEPERHVFPVRSAKAHYGSYHHDYPAADIFAPCGTTVVAPFGGRVAEVSRKDVWSAATNDGAERGGLSVSLVGDDGVRYYGSHLRSILAAIRPGVTVTAGQPLGKVGNTGDAAGIACHLHFGISPPCGTGDWEVRRGAVPPYRFLKAWQAGKDLSPEKTVVSWRKKHGCQ